MTLIAPAYVTVNPSYMFPGVLMPIFQASGAFDLLAGGEPMIRLGEDDLAVYMPRLDIRTRVAASQSTYNELPSCEIVASMISTATYQFRTRAEYDHHDTAAAARYRVGLPEAYSLGMKQAMYQLARTANLMGMNPGNGEGIVHANGATALTLPPDSSGNDTIGTYDNGQMAFFLNQLIQQMKTRTFQGGIPQKFTICGPQECLLPLEYNVVQLVQFQREGAGTTSTAGVVKHVLGQNGDEIKWVYDDTLIGVGQNGTDLIIITMPQVQQGKANRVNTNIFAELETGEDATVLQLTDMAAPREIPTPIPGGGVDVVSEQRFTSGWPMRPECVTLLSAQP